MEDAAGNTHADIVEDFSRSEGLFRTLFEYGNDGVFVYSAGPDGTPQSIVETNNRICRLLGYTRDELLALSPKDLFVATGQARIPDGRGTRPEPVDQQVFPAILAAKGGDLLEVEISNHSFERAGQPCTASIVRDRTEAARAERQRARAVAVCDNTLDSMTDMVSVHDRDFRILNANKALTDFVGMKQSEVRGKFCYEVFHGLDGEWPGCPHRETMETGKPATLMFEDPRLGISLEVTCTPFLDEEGQLFGSVHVARNVTSQQDGEREKDRLIAELKLALGDVKRLSGLLPICCECKKVRDREGNWTQLELYIRDRSDAEFTHGYCPECFEIARQHNGVD